MKLVGFGCSFTYGSELQSSDIDPNDHWANVRYRNENCWLGLLANYFNCDFDNRAEPANSNFAIAQQVADYILNSYNFNDNIVICVGWTERTRMSWYDKQWTHNGFAGDESGWQYSAKEWVVRSTNESHNMFTKNAKLFVNSICSAQSIPILQFNALGIHSTTQYPNYFIDGSSMDGMLKRAQQEDDRLNLFASNGHPNEIGHDWFTKRLYLFAKERIIL